MINRSSEKWFDCFMMQVLRNLFWMFLSLLSLLCGIRMIWRLWFIGLNRLLTLRKSKIISFFAIILFRLFAYLVSLLWKLDRPGACFIGRDRFCLINCCYLENNWLEIWAVMLFNIFLWRLTFWIELFSSW